MNEEVWHNIFKDWIEAYKAIGKHFNGNPYKMAVDILELHGERIITENLLYPDVIKTYVLIKSWLEVNKVEGIVFWKDNEPICKIKRSDFGLMWPVKR